MTRDRNQTIAGVILVTTLATVALPILIVAYKFAATSHPPDDLVLWVGTLAFHGAFTAGQWCGFAVIALILSFGGFLSAQPRTRLWSRTALALLMAMAISAGWQGYRYQQRSAAIARANQALCPLPSKTNRTAMMFRATLDTSAAADRASREFHFQVPIDNVVSRFMPAGVSLAKAQALAKDAGLNVLPATPTERDLRGPSLAFFANCDYAAGDLESQAINIAVYQDMDAAGQPKVGRTEALIINNSAL